MLTDETDKSGVKRVLRKIAPWYAAIVAVYTPLHAIYGWYNYAAGLLKAPLGIFLFNVSEIVGVTVFISAFFGFGAGVAGASVGTIGGEILDLLGFDGDKLRGVIWVVVPIAVIGSAIWFLFVVRIWTFDFAEPPKHGIEWFLAVLGATVLTASYLFFGRKLAKRLKSWKAELETR